MESSSESVLVAPCGLHCGLCTEYKAAKCPGCRDIKGKCPVIGGTCETFVCANQHKIEFCFECAEFPCAHLHPGADMADNIPHNMKIYNLLRIQKYGLSEWMRDASEIRQRYFTGKMIIGKGPQL